VTNFAFIEGSCTHPFIEQGKFRTLDQWSAITCHISSGWVYYVDLDTIRCGTLTCAQKLSGWPA